MTRQELSGKRPEMARRARARTGEEAPDVVLGRCDVGARVDGFHLVSTQDAAVSGWAREAGGHERAAASTEDAGACEHTAIWCGHAAFGPTAISSGVFHVSFEAGSSSLVSFLAIATHLSGSGTEVIGRAPGCVGVRSAADRWISIATAGRAT
jgi:hypothetical protein